MSFGTFEANLSDAGLCDYLLQDLDDDPGALYNTGECARAATTTAKEATRRRRRPRAAPKPPPAKKPRKADSAPRERRPRPRSTEEEIGTASWPGERDCGRSLFESLQQQVTEVERENALLKELVRTTPALQPTPRKCWLLVRLPYQLWSRRTEGRPRTAECVRFHAHANAPVRPALLLHHGPLVRRRYPHQALRVQVLPGYHWLYDRRGHVDEPPIPARAGGGPESRAGAEQGD